MNLLQKICGIGGVVLALNGCIETRPAEEVIRTRYDRVSILDRLYHRQENLGLTSTRENYHAIYERIAQLDARFREKLDSDKNNHLSIREFSQFLETIGYDGQTHTTTPLYYGYCEDVVSHGHSGRIVFQPMNVDIAGDFLIMDRSHYELDPNLVEEFLER